MGQSKDFFMQDREDQSTDPYYEAEIANAADFAEHEQRMREEPKLSEMLAVQFPVTKRELEIQAEQSVDYIINNSDPLRIAEAIKAIEEFMELVRKNPKLVDFVRTEAEKYKGGRVDLTTGTKIEAKEVGTKYDFTGCGDSVWERMNSEKESITERMKVREGFLKTVPADGLQVLNPDTGELETIYPPTKTSTSSYTVTLKK